MQTPAFLSRILPGAIPDTMPVLSLLLVNIITIILAVLQHWDVATVLFVYWLQSIIIGFFTVILLLTSGMNVKYIPENEPTPLEAKFMNAGGAWIFRIFMAGFFCIHYGIFHLVYYEFVVDSGLFGPVNFSDSGIYVSAGLFFCNHLYSFVYHWKDHINERGDAAGDDFFDPYKRILPMHVTIIFGSMVMFALEAVGISWTTPVLVLFLVLKTCADLTGHNEKYAKKNPGF
jgi:hypothetical protein